MKIFLYAISVHLSYNIDKKHKDNKTYHKPSEIF